MAEPAWVGRTIDGRYAVVSLLGSGGMGVVLRARHTFTGSEVALKMLRPELQLDPQLESRFLAEARAPNQIGHPAIVQVMDAGRTPQGELYLVMELLAGQPLRNALARRLPPVEIRRIARELLDALGAAHGRGFVHRDLKPENVFLAGPSAAVKLLDFGIAKGVTSATIGLPRTAAGVVLGTLAYMAPEQLQDASSVDSRADLWAMGVMLYEMLALRLPFQATTIEDLYIKLARHEPDPISRWVPTIAPAIEQFFTRALARDPEARFRSASEMAAAFAALPLDPVGAPAGVPPRPAQDGPNATLATSATLATNATVATGFALNTPAPAVTPPPAAAAPPATGPHPHVPASPSTGPSPHVPASPSTGPSPYVPASPSTGPYALAAGAASAPPTGVHASAVAPPPAGSSRALGALLAAVAVAAIAIAIAIATRSHGSRRELATGPASGSGAEPRPEPRSATPPPPDAATAPPADARGALGAAIGSATHGSHAPRPGTPHPVDPYAQPQHPATLDCAASCTWLNGCGLASRNCLAECQKTAGYHGCVASAAGDCDAFAACFLAPGCGPVGHGTASCNDTLTCQLRCEARDQTCACRCAGAAAHANLAEWLAYNTCTAGCAGDGACITRRCTSAYNRCRAQ